LSPATTTTTTPGGGSPILAEKAKASEAQLVIFDDSLVASEGGLKKQVGCVSFMVMNSRFLDNSRK